MKALKKVGKIAVSVVLWLIILVAALFTFTSLATRDQDHISSIAGYTPLTVLSDSMAPEFYSGDLIVIKQCDPSELVVGDVICFHTIIENEYALNTHRIYAIEDNGSYRKYTTKGDNNAVTDQSVITDNDIVGKYVFKISKLGKLMEFLSSSIGFLLVIVLPLLIFFIYQVYHLVMIGIAVKKASALEKSQAHQDAVKAQQEAEKASEDAEKAKSEAEKAKAEAQAALEEALRLRAEAEAKLAEANSQKAAEIAPAEEQPKVEEAVPEASEEKVAEEQVPEVKE